eukprot:Plantae.Rhodophyta-Purpureofilum_apyrenoidigerum.ctg9816.p1 GENE.Plantae.Rhodophyta-Purpureofilum_apyrenoidigerum.ctg9816~~Plantae.Rhodophyta-Purpureofilum_apyrenoidigerum.ctg9816.p1  ORF type:complete len:960 (-),score=189.39 Plantae.Rhodophyta-Purpureofilum_apyrenoidigerum.ctg9816:292-3171(-)
MVRGAVVVGWGRGSLRIGLRFGVRVLPGSEGAELDLLRRCRMGKSITALLKVHYKVRNGGSLILLGSRPELGGSDETKALKLKSTDGENWELKLTVDLSDPYVGFKYGVLQDEKRRFEAIQTPRSLPLQGLQDGDVVTLRDTWRSPKSNVFVSSAFREAIFAGKPSGDGIARSDSALGDKTAATIWKAPKDDCVTVRFTIVVPRLTYGHTVHLTGDHELLGGWNVEKKASLVNMGRNLYSIILQVPRADFGFEYKYCIFDENDKFVFRERGQARKLEKVDDEVKFLSIDETFKYETTWKGAGVAVPVFSLRSEQSIGIGEFLDIKGLVDWANLAGLTMVQVLPVNDTGDNPSPYSATSVFALHPVYINIQEAAKTTFGSHEKVPADIKEEMEAARAELEKLKEIDYTAVLEQKRKLLQKIFDKGGELVLSDAGCKNWLDLNSNWLQPYACWKSIMSETGEWDFTKWDYTVKDVPKLADQKSKYYPSVRYHSFVQYLLHKQLLEASRYARRHGVALKGDLPIGVARYCADTWSDPTMFRMEWSAGAPAHGPPPAQNWDFPLYNWEMMKKDKYQWWRRRLTAMEEYFQAFRIDHVLGFFRIWAIPAHNYSGLLGRYDPCPKPITTEELKDMNIKDKDLPRLLNPYITEQHLKEKLGVHEQFVKETFLERSEEKDMYKFKEEFSTQAQIHDEIFHSNHDEKLTPDDRNKIKKELFSFVDDRVLIRDDSDPNKYYQTCHLFYTSSYNELENEDIKKKMEKLWHNFFWERQNWRDEGYEKLNAMQDAANMMVCGEDLGAVPAEAYEVLEGLGILGLRIQRWPIHGPWGDPKQYSYLSVAAPSCHDCSTVRQWWNEDKEARQNFYKSNFSDDAPWECYDWVSQKIVDQHMASSSMWAIIPIQDYMDMWDELRSSDPLKDMINRPGTTEGNWAYRMRLTLNELCQKSSFNKFLLDMVQRNGRMNAY